MATYREQMETFTLETLPDLDVAVMAALELFEEAEVPAVQVDDLACPLVVGSGNAEITGRIVFHGKDAVFGSESTFEEQLQSIKRIDSVVVISASGEKHAPIIVKAAKAAGKRVVLMTANPESTAGSLLGEDDRHYVFPKNREPYTYNTSTYMGMMLGATGEDAGALRAFIESHAAELTRGDLGAFHQFYITVPPQFAEIVRMLHVKFIELFGRNVARDIETSEYTLQHATTVVPSNELFITFGEAHPYSGPEDRRMIVPLPERLGYAGMMAIGYYVIGQVQKAHPPYFKQNIQGYTERASKTMSKSIAPIVE